MPEGIVVEVADGLATIDFVDSSLKGTGLNRLLAAAGPGGVEVLTREGPRRRYRVPEIYAEQAGFLDVAGSLPRGDTGFAAALADADAQQRGAARIDQPTSANTFSGSTSFDEARGSTDHVQSTLVPGSGSGATHPPLHADVIAKVTAPTATEPSEDWKRSELDAYARRVGVNRPEGLPNKTAVLDAIATA